MSRRCAAGSFSPSSASSVICCVGVQAGLDALGELDLLLGVEQRDLADLLQVRADRVRGGGELGVLAGLPQRLGLLLVPDEVAGGLVLLGRLGDVVVTGRPRRAVLAALRCRRLPVGVLHGDVVDLDDLEVLEFDVGLVDSRSSGSASRSSAGRRGPSPRRRPRRRRRLLGLAWPPPSWRGAFAAPLGGRPWLPAWRRSSSPRPSWREPWWRCASPAPRSPGLPSSLPRAPFRSCETRWRGRAPP